MAARVTQNEQEDTSITSVLQRLAKPFLLDKDVGNLLRRLHGLGISEIKEYPSYDDRTYYVRTDSGAGRGPDEFVFKVMNSEFTADEGVVATQTAIMDHVSKSFPELRCQIPVPNLEGNLVSLEMVQNANMNGIGSAGDAGEFQKKLSAVRLFKYIQGRPIQDFAPVASAFFYKIGKHLGVLQQAFKTYPGDVGSLKRKASNWIWCLDNVSQLRHYLWCVGDDDDRRLVLDVISEFEKTVAPMLGQLRKGVVHHDCNNYNVLLNLKSTDENGGDETSNAANRTTSLPAETYEIMGIIDFDDTLFSCLVYEIATAMMYMMFCSDRPLEAAAFILAGFESRAPLPRKERHLLRVLVASRFLQSLVLGLYSFKQNPSNLYLNSMQQDGWDLLRLFWSKSEEDLMTMWEKTASMTSSVT